MNIVVFAPDIPYPPNRGGRADIWRRIEAFAQLGHQVMLVNAQESEGPNAPTAADLAYVDSIVSHRYSIPIKRGFLKTVKQLALSWLLPWHAATRVPTPVEKAALVSMMDKFPPDCLWLDGPLFSVVCNQLTKRYAVPILYRSHNIEHAYMRGQARAAVKLRDRLAWAITCVGLRRFETKTMRCASSIFDISVDDLQYWKSLGMQRIHWLPPLPELAFRGRPSNINPSDLLFIGNLGTPNNVRGVEWLLTEILPRVRAGLPNISCRVVGSNPTPFISQLLKTTQGVELCANVPDSLPYLFGAKVLVNPVMTGSGVQVKMLDMLMTDAPIVTALQGTRGLPADFKSLFRIADDADLFAQAVCEELAASSVDIPARIAAREVFSVAAVGQALAVALAERDSNGCA